MSCGNLGLAFAMYLNEHANSTPNAFNSIKYLTLDLAAFKHHKSFDASGTIKRVSCATTLVPANTSVYKLAPAKCGLLTIKHCSFVFALHLGIYVFNMPASHNIAFMWLSNKAQAGWMRANADKVQLFQGPQLAMPLFVFTSILQQEHYYPLHLV
jgi:hypothetical protein